ncbi:MAG: hypothetical protein JWP81_3050 [Ferruginibacter sp.]|nr:hypothetical protein [Ferruginibacter sp.]
MQSMLTNYKCPMTNYIPELKLKQLRYEIDTWKRLLAFMMEENVHLKNRISEILKDKFDKNWLEKVEYFQSSFITQDQLIGILRNDVAIVEKLLMLEQYEDDRIISQIGARLKKIRGNIIAAERQFGILKMEFNSYLLENR